MPETKRTREAHTSQGTCTLHEVQTGVVEITTWTKLRFGPKQCRQFEVLCKQLQMPFEILDDPEETPRGRKLMVLETRLDDAYAIIARVLKLPLDRAPEPYYSTAR